MHATHEWPDDLIVGQRLAAEQVERLLFLA